MEKMKTNSSKDCFNKQMVTVNTAKSGLPYAIIDNYKIHSSYDPQKEAARFLDHKIDKTPSLVVILGPGLGYLIEETKKRFPCAKVLSIFYSSFFYSYCVGDKNGDYLEYIWHPGSPLPLRNFLDFHISDLDVEGIQIIEWPPCAEAFSNLSAVANLTINQVIRERNGSIVTTLTFGKRWLNNIIYNFLFIDRIEPVRKSNKPAIIVASGPSLSRGLDLLATYREKVNLWALPSSLQALYYYDIEPDAVIITDPGFYSTFHFHPLLNKRRPTIIMPLTASRGVVRQCGRVALFSHSFFAEDVLLEHAGLSIESVPSLGTVAATAIEIALRTTETAPIFVAGLDLAHDDLKTHVSPHAFDDLFISKQNRLYTMRSILFNRMYKNGTTGSHALPLKTYAGWFSRQKQHYGGRVYRLFPSKEPIESMVSCTREQFVSLINSYRPESYQKGTGDQSPSTHMPATLREQNIRISIIKNILSSWITRISRRRGSEYVPFSIDDLRRDETVFNLFFYFSLQELIELKRDLRIKTKGRVDDVYDRLCKTTEEFLEHLYERISIL
jgi:hypothetical protein